MLSTDWYVSKLIHFKFMPWFAELIKEPADVLELNLAIRRRLYFEDQIEIDLRHHLESVVGARHLGKAFHPTHGDACTVASQTEIDMCHSRLGGPDNSVRIK